MMWRIGLPVAGALLLAACQKQEEVAPPREKVTLTAVAGQTRTSLGSDDSVLWSAGDTFLMFGDSSDRQQFVLTEGAGSSTAAFEGYLPEGEKLFAVYPESSVIDADSYGYMQMWLPQQQVYVPGSFAENANPMVAWASGEVSQLNFRNLCGVLELQVSGEGTLASVNLSSNQTMSGRMSVSMLWENSEAVMLQTDTPLGVELVGINEPLSAEPLSLYFVVPAGMYEALTVTMTDASGAVVVKTATDPVQVERAAITPVEGLVFEQAAAETVTVNMTIDTAQSDWKTTCVNYELVGDVAATDFLACFLSQEDVDANLAAGIDLDAILTATGQVIVFENNMKVLKWATEAGTPQCFLAGALLNGELVGTVSRLDYTTPEMPVDPSITFDPEWTVGDTFFSWTSTVTGATRYHIMLGMGPIWGELTDSEALTQLMINDPDGHELDGETFVYVFDDLLPETEYELLLLFESPNGNSQLYRYPFTTLALQEGDDTAEYRQFIGMWTMQYDDLMGWGNEPVTVTVEQATVGRTYRVSGMMGETADLYGVDDTIEAWFEDGQLVLRGATLVADAGSSFEFVAFYPFGASVDMYDPTGQYIGTYADGTVTFANSVATNLNACGFITFVDDNVSYGSNVYGNVVWTREQGHAAVVEPFVRNPEVDPVWK